MTTTSATLRRHARRVTATGTTLVVAAAAMAAAPPAGAADDGATQPRAVTVTLTEGTNIAAALAPDGSVVMDLHGLLHRVPAGGGETRRLTTAADEAARPDVGPDGRLVFQAYRDGGFHIWTTAPDGGDLTQLTSGGFDDREPRWSPDGAHVAFSSDRGGSYDIWSIEVATGALTQWTKAPGQELTPSWSPDGTRVVHVADNQVMATDRAGASTVLVPRPATGVTLNVPAMAPDGQRVAYVEQQGTRADLKVDGRAVTQGQDVFLFTPEWTGAGRHPLHRRRWHPDRRTVHRRHVRGALPRGRPADGPDLPEEGARPRRALTTSSRPGCSPPSSRPTAGACSSSRSTTCG